MKRLIIGIVVVIILMSIGLIGTLPGILAGPPEEVGAPSVIVSPLDEDGDVKVSLDEAIEVTTIEPILVTSEDPLPVVLIPSPPESIQFIVGENFTPGHLKLDDFRDVSSYSKFKIYAKVTPGPSSFPITESPPTVQFTVYEGPGGGEIGLSWVDIPLTEWKGFYLPIDPPISFWGLVWEFEGIYSEIAIPVWNLPPGPPFNGDGVTRTVDAWILMGN